MVAVTSMIASIENDKRRQRHSINLLLTNGSFQQFRAKIMKKVGKNIQSKQNNQRIKNDFITKKKEMSSFPLFYFDVTIAL